MESVPSNRHSGAKAAMRALYHRPRIIAQQRLELTRKAKSAANRQAAHAQMTQKHGGFAGMRHRADRRRGDLWTNRRDTPTGPANITI